MIHAEFDEELTLRLVVPVFAKMVMSMMMMMVIWWVFAIGADGIASCLTNLILRQLVVW